MKKKLLILLVVAAASSVSAQSNKYSSKTYLGVNFGYGFSGIMFQPKMDQKAYPSSYSGGLSFKYKGEKYMSFQGEVNYSHRGYRQIGEKVDYERTLNAVMIPIMAQGNVTYKRLNAIIDLGCYASYILNSQERSPANGPSTDYEFLLARDHHYEFGVLAGGGFYFDLKPILFQVSARYYYGLTNMMSPAYMNHKPDDSRLYQLQISGSLFFDLGSIFAKQPKLTKK